MVWFNPIFMAISALVSILIHMFLFASAIFRSTSHQMTPKSVLRIVNNASANGRVVVGSLLHWNPVHVQTSTKHGGNITFSDQCLYQAQYDYQINGKLYRTQCLLPYEPPHTIELFYKNMHPGNAVSETQLNKPNASGENLALRGVIFAVLLYVLLVIFVPFE